MSKYLPYNKKITELMPDLAEAEHTAHELYGNKCGDDFHIFSTYVSANNEKGIEISLGIAHPTKPADICWRVIGEILLEEYSTNRIYRIRDPQKERPHMTYGPIGSDGRCSSVDYDPDYQYIDRAGSVKELLIKMEKYRSEYLNTGFVKLKKKILQRQNYKTKKLLDSLP